jgi:nucleoside-diphosphate-sugar epimerase
MPSGQSLTMNVLIAGASGNLGSRTALNLLQRPVAVRLMIHRRPLPTDLARRPGVSVARADLEDPRTLAGPCEGIDCIVHFAGVLFAPRPEGFLHRTNAGYMRNLVGAARAAGVRKFILISFPHVEGESTPDRPATGRLDARPESVHAATRLAAERHLLDSCRDGRMTPVILRSGMIYGRGVLLIEAARWLLRRRLLAVWRRPTWIHLLALPDFLRCVEAAIAGEDIQGVYNLGDDQPKTLQAFLDAAADHWKLKKPWRLPDWMFPVAGSLCEASAALLGTRSPLTRDFIRIGMASYAADTSRMKRDLASRLEYPTLREGLAIL